MNPVIIITIEGGCISMIHSTDPFVEVHIIDTDQRKVGEPFYHQEEVLHIVPATARKIIGNADDENEEMQRV